jgi:recombinational DNA repair protein (RecF pathway)
MSIAQRKPETRRNSKPDSDRCSRCRREAPTRGRFTQTIRGKKRFICAECCSTLSSVGALIRSAEESERELERQRFQTRRYTRPADRREAA